jgi:hypothetical protein
MLGPEGFLPDAERRAIRTSLLNRASCWARECGTPRPRKSLRPHPLPLSGHPPSGYRRSSRSGQRLVSWYDDHSPGTHVASVFRSTATHAISIESCLCAWFSLASAPPRTRFDPSVVVNPGQGEESLPMREQLLRLPRSVGINGVCDPTALPELGARLRFP